MCGIDGFDIDGRDVPETSAVPSMALSSRASDASWSVIRGTTAYANTRLDLIDLSDAVVYPTASERNDVHLAFNDGIC
jgi:hypothetical protein